MSKRVFTKIFRGEINVELAMPTIVNGFFSWLVQEDIELVGAEISLQNDMPSENDGFATCELELSQTGLIGGDGAILDAKAMEGWNTVPQGICNQNAHVVLVLPQGVAIPIKEEGHLYLNTRGYGKTADLSYFEYCVIIYYTKGRSR
ncbi:hypothetical protein ES708_16963 [subsurface metagenome]